MLAVPAFPQSSNGSVRGTVQDQTKAVIPGANVTLTNTATNIEFKTTSNSVGIYVFPAVPAGPYKLTVEYSGMAKFEGTLTVRVQESATVDVTLQTAATTTTITVQDVTPLVVSDSQSLGHTLERARIEQLPINGRQVMNLLNTVPGLTFDTNGDLRTMGARTGTHDVSLDGAALSEPVYGGGTVRRQPSLESIQEFKVDVNAVSAKYARQTNVVMTTKAGGNEIHGSLFETNRDNGYGWARKREDGNTAAKFIRNEYGGTIGGPVYIPKVYNGKNKTFFFFSYEGMKQRSGQTGRWRVPTEAMRNGDFTGLVDANGTLQKIYNPYATAADGSRPQFAYNGVANTIDPSLQSPLFQYWSSVLPLPNQPGINPLVGNNYFGPKPDLTDEWTWSARFDQRIGDNDQLYVRMTDSSSNRFRAAQGGVPTSDSAGNARTDFYPSKSLAANWTRSFSPTFFNEFMFSVSRTTGGLYAGTGLDQWATKLGLPNPGNQAGYPVVGNFITGSGNYFQPPNATSQWFNHFILDDNATKIVGRHEIQFGAHLRYGQLTYLPQQQRSAGAVNFSALGTALYDPNIPNRTRATLNTGSALASAYLGLANYEYRVNKGRYYLRQNEDAAYIQDNFKVTQRLTLMGGLRWQFSPYPKDKYDIFSGFDPKNMAIVLGNSLENFYKLGVTSPAYINYLQSNGAKFETPEQAGLPKRLVNNNWFDIGPHVGFAYRALDGKKSFVLRGGYSISYFPIPLWGWNDNMRNNAPFTGFYANPWMTAPASSPDGIRNYGLVSTPQWIAGKNSTNAVTLNDLNPGSIIIGEDAYNAAYFDPDQPSARVHDWNLTLEKELMANTVLRVAYVGNHLSNQDAYVDVNQTIPEYVWYKTLGIPRPDNDRASAEVRPYSTSPYGEVKRYTRDGWGNANGGTIEIERRLSKGYGFQFFYQLINSAKAGAHGWYGDSGLDPVSSFLPGTVPTNDSERMRLLMYARDWTIPKHEVRWNWIVELPFGKGKPVLRNASKLLDAFVGGWQVTGMGRMRSNYFTLPTDIWPTGNPVEYYGHKYPIQDCRSGSCIPGYLMWNGYIPEHLINQPNGIMGVPANYKPAATPLWPYPANYASLQGDDPNASNYDPNYGYYGGNTEFVTLKDGTIQEVWKDGAQYSGTLHPWRNQPVMSTRIWSTDAALFKTFRIGERMNLKVQGDFFNVFNTPGNEFAPGNDGIVHTDYSMQDARQIQLSARFSW
ncbi:MAG: carboxypeptidase-like regulatory domain-containing protein [Acidobacteriota bacterium]